MEALMAVRPAGGEEGSYRFTLAGAEHVKLQIHVYEVLKHEPFKNVYLDLQMELGTQVKTHVEIYAYTTHTKENQ